MRQHDMRRSQHGVQGFRPRSEIPLVITRGKEMNGWSPAADRRCSQSARTKGRRPVWGLRPPMYSHVLVAVWHGQAVVVPCRERRGCRWRRDRAQTGGGMAGADWRQVARHGVGQLMAGFGSLTAVPRVGLGRDPHVEGGSRLVRMQPRVAANDVHHAPDRYQPEAVPANEEVVGHVRWQGTSARRSVAGCGQSALCAQRGLRTPASRVRAGLGHACLIEEEELPALLRRELGSAVLVCVGDGDVEPVAAVGLLGDELRLELHRRAGFAVCNRIAQPLVHKQPDERGVDVNVGWRAHGPARAQLRLERRGERHAVHAHAVRAGVQLQNGLACMAPARAGCARRDRRWRARAPSLAAAALLELLQPGEQRRGAAALPLDHVVEARVGALADGGVGQHRAQVALLRDDAHPVREPQHVCADCDGALVPADAQLGEGDVRQRDDERSGDAIDERELSHRKDQLRHDHRQPQPDDLEPELCALRERLHRALTCDDENEAEQLRAVKAGAAGEARGRRGGEDERDEVEHAQHAREHPGSPL
eukprot:scaffold25968_cov24-Tisochrysis_lutea.AAC.2